jgi:acetyl esterase/lipase
MEARMLRFICLLLLVNLDSSVQAQSVLDLLYPKKPKVEKPYLEAKNTDFATVDGKSLKYDLAIPKQTNSKKPVVVCFHGGAWRMGKRSDMVRWIDGLARNGYVVASVGYRLAPDYPWPSQIEDCKTAIRSLRANADRYGIDPNRIAVLGESAGGHLALLTGMTKPEDGFEGKSLPEQSSEVQAVVSVFGPTDLTLYAQDDSAQRSVFQPMFGKKFSESSEPYIKASPIHYVRKGLPPILMLHGTSDRVVPIEHAKTLYQKLRDTNNPARLIEYDREDHGWFDPRQAMALRDVLDFLKETIGK